MSSGALLGIISCLAPTHLLPPPHRSFHLWYSRENPGANELIDELRLHGGWAGRLLVTNEPEQMDEADQLLGMGFSEEHVVEALTATGNDVEAAMEICLSGVVMNDN